jgi:hypothetical protein
MNLLRSLFRKLASCTAGTATMEAVIVMPLAISLMVGGVEFGRAISAHSTVDKSMRSATRYLARVPEDGICTWGLDNARNIAVYGQIANTGTPLVPEYTTANITFVSPGCGPLGDPAIVELSAAVPFTLIMLNAAGFSNTRTLNVRHQERYIGE